MGSRCLSPREWSDSHPNGLTADLDAHLEICQPCRCEWRALEELAQLTKHLPSFEPDAGRVAQTRAALLGRAAAMEPAGHDAIGRWRSLAAAAAVLAVALAGVVVALLVDSPGRATPTVESQREVAGAGLGTSPRPPSRPELRPKHQPERTVGPAAARPGVASAAPPAVAPAPVAAKRKGELLAHEGARFMRVSELPDEVVRLVDGTLSVRVEPLTDGERFRVIVGDAEVEVVGTAFDVVASRDRLVDLRVLHGRVEVRRRGQAPRLLSAGERWAPRAAVAEPPRPERRSRPKRKHRRRRKPAEAAAKPAPPRSPAEQAFEAGWAALRAGDPWRAEQDFLRVSEHDAPPGLTEDAAFWRAVALARAKRRTAAIAALSAFVQRYPGSARRAEAAAILGWIRVDQSKLSDARRLFELARNTGKGRVKRSAIEGLRALDAAEPEPIGPR